MRHLLTRTAALLVTIGLLLGQPSAASAQTTENGHSASRGAGFVAGRINEAGYIEGPGGSVDHSSTAYAVMAMATTGIGPDARDRAVDYLSTHVDAFVKEGADDKPGALALLIMALDANDEDPTAVGGDLVARLKATERASGDDAGLYGVQSPSFDGAYRQSLALLALAAVGETDAEAIEWLTEQQCPDGGWQAYRATNAGTLAACDSTDLATFKGEDTNSTALAAQALRAQAVTPAASPLTWLQDAQNADGGWGYFKGSATDANSTALSAMAFTAAGVSPDDTVPAGDSTPYDALMALQLECADGPSDYGAFAYQRDGDGDLVANVFATVQAVPALAGQAYPVERVPDRPLALPGCVAPSPSATPAPTVAPRPSVAPTVVARPAPPAVAPTLVATGGWGRRPWDATGLAVTGAGLVGYGVLALLGAHLVRRRRRA